MTKKFLSFAFAFFMLIKAASADEGMWLLHLVAKINGKTMQEMGLEMSPEDIYNTNQASLKDAIVAMGGGFCTGEIISDQGLLLTNHHCAYGNLQSFSSVENDILKNGFWAANFKEEIPVPDLFVTALQRIDDVTREVLAEVTDDMDELTRSQTIRKTIGALKEKYEKEGIQIVIKSFFSGNQYLMFTNKLYKDVRLVGAPDESIGKFGGDTDNWMWPRHTGDFALYRIYADENNEPAEYSPNNKPLSPKWHLPVSLDGVQEGDFAMILGYPGSTDRFLSSFGVQMALEIDQPARIALRKERLAAMKKNMDADPAVRIQYASKYASVSNYYKYFIGQSKGLKELDVYNKKVAIEDEFAKWVEQSDERKEKYGMALSFLAKGYKNASETKLAEVYHFEAGYSSELPRFSSSLSSILTVLKELDEAKAEKKKDKAKIKELNEKLKETISVYRESLDDIYKDYDLQTDKDVTSVLFSMYGNDIPKDQRPSFFNTIDEDYSGNILSYVEEMFNTSLLADRNKLEKFLKKPNAKTIEEDIAYNTFFSIIEALRNRNTDADEMKNHGYRLFVAGLMEQQPDKKWYPNANSSMRLTYGQVLPYTANDKDFHFLTYAMQIAEKANPDDPEFIVPSKLMELIKNNDYGVYKRPKDEDLVVNFITNNDITGGNSGSPVINGKGHLIGCAFDGNWEAMSGDIAFEPKLQRTIVVDARYILFIIDKYANATHLVNEMTLVKDGQQGKGEKILYAEPAKTKPAAPKKEEDMMQQRVKSIDATPEPASATEPAVIEVEGENEEE
jgi:hypothetical protein